MNKKYHIIKQQMSPQKGHTCMVGMQIAHGLKGFDGTTPKVALSLINKLSSLVIWADQIPMLG